MTKEKGTKVDCRKCQFLDIRYKQMRIVTEGRYRYGYSGIKDFIIYICTRTGAPIVLVNRYCNMFLSRDNEKITNYLNKKLELIT